jgi:hypothetical protein
MLIGTGVQRMLKVPNPSMANSKHLAKLKKSIEGWNAWRKANPEIVPDLSEANLSGADLSGARLRETTFANTTLNNVQGLDACVHRGPSSIDYRTIAKSGPLPLVFLRGCGLPDEFIDYLPSLLNQAIQFYSCFISYSTQDQAFAERLYADLQNKNVRCWFAPHDIQEDSRAN